MVKKYEQTEIDIFNLRKLKQYEDNVYAYHNIVNAIKTAEKKYAEGRAKGRVEGLAEGRTEVVRDML